MKWEVCHWGAIVLTLSHLQMLLLSCVLIKGEGRLEHWNVAQTGWWWGMEDEALRRSRFPFLLSWYWSVPFPKSECSTTYRDNHFIITQSLFLIFLVPPPGCHWGSADVARYLMQSPVLLEWPLPFRENNCLSMLIIVYNWHSGIISIRRERL